MAIHTAEHLPAQCETHRPQPLRLLLVDDERLVLLATRCLLENLGHSVVCATDGSEVLPLLLGERFDAVFMDIDMPEMDGMRATRLLRADKTLGAAALVPVIALTARTRICDRDLCLAAGMTDHLGKPAQAQDLRRALLRAGLAA